MAQETVTKTWERHKGRSQKRDLLLRSTGTPLVGGNALRVLTDGARNYPAWTKAIEEARDHIHLKMYIVHNDRTGRALRDLLVEKAREGVKVRVLYDWFGSLRPSALFFWSPLVKAGAEVRIANPPSIEVVFGLASRDHSKLLAVDGRVAYISGLCVGDAWIGDPDRGTAPWRDTGVELRGPAVADAEAAFAAVWKLWGRRTPIPDEDLPHAESIPEVGATKLRVVRTVPERTALYRTELSVAMHATQRFWITDAYFMPTSIYRESLRSAAHDGVDVRLLIPSSSDLPWISNYSRTLYRPLLEAGVRIFEWNGSMVHAKTAVVDGRWSRIGSSNLNPSSWVGNWELDVLVEDEAIGREMEQIFLEDLTNATEVVITERNKVRLSDPSIVKARRRARKSRPEAPTASSATSRRSAASSARPSAATASWSAPRA